MKLLTNKRIEKLAEICFGVTKERDGSYAVQLFIEHTVLPDEVGGYTYNEMVEYIKYFIKNGHKKEYKPKEKNNG